MSGEMRKRIRRERRRRRVPLRGRRAQSVGRPSNRLYERFRGKRIVLISRPPDVRGKIARWPESQIRFGPYMELNRCNRIRYEKYHRRSYLITCLRVHFLNVYINRERGDGRPMAYMKVPGAGNTHPPGFG